jgi:hypothetical protein
MLTQKKLKNQAITKACRSMSAGCGKWAKKPVPLITGALGTIKKGLHQNLQSL